MKREDLDSRQREVLDAVLGSNSKILVLGGPGTGKTTTALWCARALIEGATDQLIPRVIFLTFSRAAISQITRRCPGVISGYEDYVEIMTFHSLSYRLIKAFGRYIGLGSILPSIQSVAKTKLLGLNPGQLTYSDLIPNALKLLRSPLLRSLVSSRWQLVICDEVQDTNDEQWSLLNLISNGKLLLLGDANQLIYTFIKGVNLDQFQKKCDSAQCTIRLNPISYRDPSGAIPSLAEAIRVRRFDDVAVKSALRNKRLTVLQYSSDLDFHILLKSQIIGAKKKEIGIFAHTNWAVAEVADQLSEDQIDHVLVGIPEAHAEALSAMNVQLAYAVGLATWDDVRTALGIYLVAIVRGSKVPPLAHALAGRGALPAEIEATLVQLEADLKQASAGIIDNLASIAMQSWGKLHISKSSRTWNRAAGHFRRLIHQFKLENVSITAILAISEIIERNRIEALIDMDYSEHGRIRLMNYHQTKGREADIVIHIFRNDDYFGYDSEPFEELSRLLNVALSRARERVIVLLPPEPHPLVQPFQLLLDNL